ncbi:AAT-domain-containing protein [Hypoxylon sp. FL1150]|nr:AAT-domain-containing protein [Hypoxylon sp. FL1150]
MLEVRCSGTPYEIGVTHGKLAKEKVDGSLDFYKQLLWESASMSWEQVLQEATKYVEPLRKIEPRYVEEIQGIADGAGVSFLDILALNVRSEINFGLFSDRSKDSSEYPSDGCTSFSVLTDSKSFLCQNWDWRAEQTPNLMVYHISHTGTDIPDISMVTEAGIIGKIGFNSNGVGVCLNAIRCRGVDRSKLPVHIALRAAMEAKSREEAVNYIKSVGVAGGGHILVSDATGPVSLECTSSWVKELAIDEKGRICHSNHLILDHADIDEPGWLKDSPARLARMRALTADLQDPTVDRIFEVFKDTEGYPSSINRKQEGECRSQTLFNIIMDLTSKKAQVTFGRPTEYSERVQLAF